MVTTKFDLKTAKKMFYNGLAEDLIEKISKKCESNVELFNHHFFIRTFLEMFPNQKAQNLIALNLAYTYRKMNNDLTYKVIYNVDDTVCIEFYDDDSIVETFNCKSNNLLFSFLGSLKSYKSEELTEILNEDYVNNFLKTINESISELSSKSLSVLFSSKLRIIEIDLINSYRCPKNLLAVFDNVQVGISISDVIMENYADIQYVCTPASYFNDSLYVEYNLDNKTPLKEFISRLELSSIHLSYSTAIEYIYKAVKDLTTILTEMPYDAYIQTFKNISHKDIEEEGTEAVFIEPLYENLFKHFDKLKSKSLSEESLIKTSYTEVNFNKEFLYDALVEIRKDGFSYQPSQRFVDVFE